MISLYSTAPRSATSNLKFLTKYAYYNSETGACTTALPFNSATTLFLADLYEDNYPTLGDPSKWALLLTDLNSNNYTSVIDFKQKHAEIFI